MKMSMLYCLILILLFVGCMSISSSDHAGVAAEALLMSDTEKLDRLFAEGFPVDGNEGGATLLCSAVFGKNESMVRYLIAKGANPLQRYNNLRLIDYPYLDGATNICVLLSNTNQLTQLVDGVPSEVWEQGLIAISYDPNSGQLREVNGQPPGHVFLQWLSHEYIYPFSSDVTFSVKNTDADERKSSVPVFHIVLAKISEQKYRMHGFSTYNHEGTIVRSSRSADISKKYGWWFSSRGGNE